MSHDLVLCECACGNRITFPVSLGDAPTGFVCEHCYARIQFEGAVSPTRLELTDDTGKAYSLGFLVFSVIRSNMDLAEEVIRGWFGPAQVEVLHVEAS